MSKILFLTNNKNTYELVSRLKLNNEVVLYNNNLTINYLKKIQPELIVSYNYKHIILPEIVAEYPKIINLHISYLPWNKGDNPNFWSFIDNTPKGVSIHFIDPGIDTGDILLQKKVEFDEPKETLESSYNKLHKEIQDLFATNLDKLLHGQIKSKKQVGEGSFHYSTEFNKILNVFGKNIFNIHINELKRELKEQKLIK